MHRGIEAVRSFIESVDVYRDDRSDPTFLPPDEVDTLQGRLLRDQIVRLRQSSPYYSASLLDVELPNQVARRWLEQLPFTRKDDYQAAPERFRLHLEGANPYDRTWGLVHTTGTTTGEPTPFYDTGHDMLAYWQMLLRTCKIAGMTPDDVSVSVMPVPAMSHNAFISSRDACSVLNAPYVAAFVGTPHAEFPSHRRTDYALRLIERNQATVLWGIASYVRHLVLLQPHGQGAGHGLQPHPHAKGAALHGHAPRVHGPVVQAPKECKPSAQVNAHLLPGLAHRALHVALPALPLATREGNVPAPWVALARAALDEQNLHWGALTLPAPEDDCNGRAEARRKNAGLVGAQAMR